MIRLALACLAVFASAALAQEAPKPAEPGNLGRGWSVDLPRYRRFDEGAYGVWQKRETAWTDAHARLLAGLRAAQLPDGRMAGPEGDGAADVAATALALLAFASNGSTMRTGAHKDPIRKGIIWLKEKQAESGWFVAADLPGAIPAQAFATAAMVQIFADSNYSLLRSNAERSLRATLASDVADAPVAEALAQSLALLAVGTVPVEGDTSALAARLAALLGAKGQATVDATRAKLVGPLPGTADLATFAVAMACHGAAIPADDPRWLALAPRIVALPKRSGEQGELLDAATLFASGDAAIRLGGPAWDAWRELVTERVVPRVSAVDGKGSVTFACGIEVLRNENAESALTALALATPWYCVGTPRTRR
jgi:hypothetical protein